eukprot:768602-Hanusia_phi.AAC.17
MFQGLRMTILPSSIYWSSESGVVDGVSSGERHDAMRLLRGTWMSPVDSASFSGALQCFSGSVDEKFNCWKKNST